MQITKQQLIKFGACEEGLARFITATKGTESPVEITSLFIAPITMGDLMWLARKLIPTKRLVTLAKDVAYLYEGRVHSVPWHERALLYLKDNEDKAKRICCTAIYAANICSKTKTQQLLAEMFKE